MLVDSQNRIKHWLWLLSGLLIALILCFIPLGSSNGPQVASILDAGHYPLFGVVTLLFYLGFLKRRETLTLSKRLTIAAAMALLLAGLIELLQPLVERSASWSDLGNDALGVFVLSWLARWYERKPSFGERCSCIVFLLLATTYVAWPIYQEHVRSQIRLNRFPVLADFSDPADADLWVAEQGEPAANRQNTTIERLTEDAALRVNLGTGKWAGVSFYPPIVNWDHFAELSFNLCRASASLLLAIRIDDAHDSATPAMRFNKLLPVPEAANSLCQTITIPMAQIRQGPKSRQLNTEKIRRMIIFAATNVAPPNSQWFTIDDVRLVK